MRRKGPVFVVSDEWESMNPRRNEAAVIGRACPDPLFIAHLTDKQWIEANTGDTEGGPRECGERGNAAKQRARPREERKR